MSKLLRKPKETYSSTPGKYELLNLKENPFPVTPYVNKDNADDRYNGRIYESRIREPEHNKILSNFLKVPQINPHHIRLGYILDYSYVGRGNGKSAFTLNLIDEINRDFCLDISDEANKCFGLHITPEPSGRTKTFYNFIDLIFESIIKNNIINYSLASLRFEALQVVYSEAIDFDIEFAGEEDLVKKLNSADWFKEKEIDISKITNNIFEKAELTKISRDFPLYRDRNRYYNHYVVTQNDFEKYYSENLRAGKDKNSFIFNDLVLLFIAAGFNGSYIIIDDFERIPDFQSEKLRQEFALEIRTNFFDGVLENAKIGFYNLILVLHAGVPRLIEKAWNSSGMNRRSPISDDVSDHIVLFDKLSEAHTRLLLKKYLSEYRINNLDDESLSPFTEDAIRFIGQKSEYNASAILEKSYKLIEFAAKNNIAEINLEFVTKFMTNNELDIEDTHTENPANEASTDLLKKASRK